MRARPVVAASSPPSRGTANGHGAGLALALATDSFADLVLALNQADIYIDMHASRYPSGEIRGQLSPEAVVPEPSLSALMAVAMLFIALRWRFR